MSETPDVIVVLGAQVFASGRPSPSLQRRAALGIEVWRQYPQAHLVACGGIGNAPISEAEAIRRLVAAGGVLEDQIVLEDRSTSTLEQAMFVAGSAPGRGWQKVRVVTDRYHMPRALFLFRRAGIAATGTAVKGRGGGSRRRRLEGILREIPAWVKALGMVALGRHRRAPQR